MNYRYTASVPSLDGVSLLLAICIPLIIFLVIAVIFGICTKRLNERKGYTGGFAWGFFLGITGLIVVAIRPFNMNNPKYAPYRPADSHAPYHS